MSTTKFYPPQSLEPNAIVGERLEKKTKIFNSSNLSIKDIKVMFTYFKVENI